MKISFVSAHASIGFPQPPLGLAILAAIAENSGAETQLIDGNVTELTPTVLGERLTGSDIVCMSAMTSNLNASFALAKEIKTVIPETKIVFGGPHASILPKETLKECPSIDIVVKGEGEETFAELLSSKCNRLEKIKGICFRKGKKIIETPDSAPIKDLDSLPYPAYHLLPIRKYRPFPPHGRRLPFMTMLTSRGCPFRCIYCSKPVFGSTFRSQNPKRVLQEISFLKEKFGIKEIMFYDDSFTLDQKRVEEICRLMIENRMDIPWSCETRVNLVNPKLLMLMKKAGCYMVSFGVESGSQKILENLKKDITVEQIENAFVETKKAGIKTVAYFMLGSPGETQETINQTIEFSKKIGADFAQFSVCTPLPGSELFSLMKERIASVDWASFNYANASKLDASLLFDRKIKDLAKELRWAYLSFYLRPSYLIKKIFEMRSLDDLKTNLNGLRMLSSMLGLK